MCCFTKPVERVEQTRIYARAEGAQQLVVYELKLQASEDLAMVLPIPIAMGSGDRAVKFVDLTSSPTFFAGLAYAFREQELELQAKSRGPAPQGLAVHQVGAFEASFVPRAQDFDRLDPRFSISSALWRTVPSVDGFGFVVFKLRPSKTLRAFHPMAFWFARRDLQRVFFPTLHVHDGTVHENAIFDHVLYAQPDIVTSGWEPSPYDMNGGVGGAGRTLVLPRPGQRRVLNGSLPNADVWING